MIYLYNNHIHLLFFSSFFNNSLCLRTFNLLCDLMKLYLHYKFFTYDLNIHIHSIQNIFLISCPFVIFMVYFQKLCILNTILICTFSKLGLCLIALTFRSDEFVENWKSRAKIIVACAMISFGAFVFGVVFSKVIMYDMMSNGSKQPTHSKCWWWSQNSITKSGLHPLFIENYAPRIDLRNVFIRWMLRLSAQRIYLQNMFYRTDVMAVGTKDRFSKCVFIYECLWLIRLCHT